jgi:hypothetical protein
MTVSTSLGQEDKSRLSPEVYACAWLDIGRACEMSMTSNCEAFVPCNEWQREQFDLHGVVRRDPMFQTMSTLMELEKYPRHVSVSSPKGLAPHGDCCTREPAADAVVFCDRHIIYFNVRKVSSLS